MKRGCHENHRSVFLAAWCLLLIATTVTYAQTTRTGWEPTPPPDTLRSESNRPIQRVRTVPNVEPGYPDLQ
jgi:hypothetical protein